MTKEERAYLEQLRSAIGLRIANDNGREYANVAVRSDKLALLHKVITEYLKGGNSETDDRL
jgi:hypothetical protein